MVQDLAAYDLPLFIPATRPDRFAKAAAAAPDALIVDLEDAVAPEEKAAARAALAENLAKADLGGAAVLLRINAAGTPWHEADLAAAAALPLAGLLLAKAETPEDLRRAAQVSGLPVMALIESAKGIAGAREIAKASARLAFGSIDYAADLGMGHTRDSLLSARSELVLASRLAGIPAPLDGVTTAVQDEPRILEDCAHAAELGFSGKLLIHPAQVAAARRGFRPSEAEIAKARRVLEAAASGAAALRLDGEMVDMPVILRARRILARAALGSPAS